ncbi:serine hydrolase domain-containing protein [Kitasatospora sp. GP82]|uniref:serine hydrolase domain-containing protein n=1 Tax=Kitasatospora sp. GP82 TaxID=3035089 RepID=UPI002475AC0F|nr:serine hydrolase domain-containing protein [Kitasatospora sp. GP82]MDH6126850.1 CubicO group peptidase (beta-lactamase class C family) [Kitasatospora sp. GP82]
MPSARDWAATAVATLKDALEPLVAVGQVPGGVITAGTLDGPRSTATCGVVGAECGPAAPDEHTRYDLASLTKVVATWPLVGRAVRAGLLDLDAPVRSYLPDLPPEAPGSSLTIRHLMTHTSGLLDHTRFDRYLGDPTPLAQLICQEALISEPGSRHHYIDRGFILLGLLLTALHGRRLDLTADEMWRELGMAETAYGPLLRTPQVAPTEPRLVGAPRIWGTVHDPSAALMGGIAGHAGAFSTAADLAAFARHALTSPWLAESMRPAARIEPGRHRGLAWITTDGEPPSPVGAVAYHHGFTGTSLHLTPHSGRYLVILTNSVYYGRDRTLLVPLRALAMTTINQPM